MQSADSTSEGESHTPARLLKIEVCGDFWKGCIKPKIRLAGRWLERAGFKPGSHVHVMCVAPGVIELRSPDTMTENKEDQLSERVKAPF